MQLKATPKDQAARIHGITPEMVLGIMIINEVVVTHGKVLTITSVTDGGHGHGSLHFTGNAVDIRTRAWLPSEIQAVADDLRASLGIDFDVLIEGNHIHVEFQPKTGVNKV